MKGTKAAAAAFSERAVVDSPLLPRGVKEGLQVNARKAQVRHGSSRDIETTERRWPIRGRTCGGRALLPQRPQRTQCITGGHYSSPPSPQNNNPATGQQWQTNERGGPQSSRGVCRCRCSVVTYQPTDVPNQKRAVEQIVYSHFPRPLVPSDP